ncbi:ATP11 protein [Glomus cerebriforme]|uniref:ATP11 protein n=1 Tax=Glomus cerebriforme TaxID=658196 RepID=A0A397TF37_9GLOM|nr:ATP11 protein [Glomus cerebriforme]
MEKYYDKLKIKAEKERFSSVEEMKAEKLKAFQKDSISISKEISSNENETNSSQKTMSLPPHVKPLDKILKMDKIKDQDSETIEKLWLEYHSTKNCLSAVIPADTYKALFRRGQQYPMFVVPLPQEQGLEFYILQFQFHQCFFTSLLEYKTHGTESKHHMVLTHFPDLIDSKGIVLMHGEIVQPKLISLKSAQYLAYAMQKFYVSGTKNELDLVEKFYKNPGPLSDLTVLDDSFDYLLQELFFGSKKQAASVTKKQIKTVTAASTTATTTTEPISIPSDNKIKVPELAITPPQDYLEENLFKEALNYVIVRTSPNSINDIEVLHPINVPKEYAISPETEKLEIIKDDKNEIKKDKLEVLSGEEVTILHAIYFKQLINSKNTPYQCTLKQLYNDYVIGEAKRISSVGEPTITIHTPQLETELRRTGALSNTWHFTFEEKDYRWKPTLLGAKDSDLICELIEYEIPFASSSGSCKKKNKEVVATLKRKSESWDSIGDLRILENAWFDVKNPRDLEIILVIGCLIMLDVIEAS